MAAGSWTAITSQIRGKLHLGPKRGRLETPNRAETSVYLYIFEFQKKLPSSGADWGRVMQSYAKVSKITFLLYINKKFP